MATTESAVVDRVRAVCAADERTEAIGFDFALAPATAVDGKFTVVYTGAAPIGGMAFTEEARGTFEIAVARRIDGDYDATRRDLLDELGDLLAGIVRDGASDGEYAVEDTGRSVNVGTGAGSALLIGRLRLSVNFEVQL